MSSSDSHSDSGDISRDKLSKLVSNTDANTQNFIGQIDPFCWIIVGLTLGFYGVCLWLVTETLSMKSEVQGLKSEVQSLSAAIERIERKLE